MTHDVKKWLVWINLALFSATVWYCIAELFITYIWQIMYKWRIERVMEGSSQRENKLEDIDDSLII